MLNIFHQIQTYCPTFIPFYSPYILPISFIYFSVQSLLILLSEVCPRNYWDRFMSRHSYVHLFIVVAPALRILYNVRVLYDFIVHYLYPAGIQMTAAVLTLSSCFYIGFSYCNLRSPTSLQMLGLATISLLYCFGSTASSLLPFLDIPSSYKILEFESSKLFLLAIMSGSLADMPCFSRKTFRSLITNLWMPSIIYGGLAYLYHFLRVGIANPALKLLEFNAVTVVSLSVGLTVYCIWVRNTIGYLYSICETIKVPYGLLKRIDYIKKIVKSPRFNKWLIPSFIFILAAIILDLNYLFPAIQRSFSLVALFDVYFLLILGLIRYRNIYMNRRFMPESLAFVYFPYAVVAIGCCYYLIL